MEETRREEEKKEEQREKKEQPSSNRLIEKYEIIHFKIKRADAPKTRGAHEVLDLVVSVVK